MTKLILTFEQRHIRSYALNGPSLLIGRSSSCDIHIDSLRLAEQHAQVDCDGQTYTIRSINLTHPLIVNRRQVDSMELNHGDMIDGGGYSLMFSDPEAVDQFGKIAGIQSMEKMINKVEALPSGSIQIQSGRYIGRTISLKRSLTKLGMSEYPDRAVITHRQDGYHIAHLRGESPTINGKSIGSEDVLMRHNDILTLGVTRFRFFETDS